MQEEEQLIKELNEIIQKPGGKQAVRFALNALGAVPAVGGLISGAGNLWGEKEQHAFNERIVEWATKADADVHKILSHLDDQLREPTKTHMALLIGEVTGRDPGTMDAPLRVPVILNGETVSELQPYVGKEWLSLPPNGNVTNMGAGNRIGDSIEDRKRPWGMGNGFMLTVSPAYFLEDEI